MPPYVCCNWASWKVSNLKFTKQGNHLFSTSPGISIKFEVENAFLIGDPGLLNGVTMWDVETQQPIQVFNHHKNNSWEMVLLHTLVNLTHSLWTPI